MKSQSTTKTTTQQQRHTNYKHIFTLTKTYTTNVDTPTPTRRFPRVLVRTTLLLSLMAMWIMGSSVVCLSVAQSSSGGSGSSSSSEPSDSTTTTTPPPRSDCIDFDNTSGYIEAGLFPAGHPQETLPKIVLVGGNAVRSGLALIGRTGIVNSPKPIDMTRNFEGETISFVARFVGSEGDIENPKGFKYRDANLHSFFTVSVLNTTHLTTTIVPLPSYELNVEESLSLVINTSSLNYCSEFWEEWPVMQLTVSPRYIEPDVEGADALGTAGIILTSFSSLAAATDLQALAVISLMQCNTPNKRELGNYRILAPAAFDNTLTGVLGGNFVVIIGTFIAHVGAVFLFRTKCLPAHATLIEAASSVFFPAVTLVITFTLFQGILVASFNLVIGEFPDRFERFLGALGTVFIVLFFLFCLLFPKYFLSRVFYTATFPDIHLPATIKWLILPEGVLMPVVLRRMFSVIINVRRYHPLWCTVRFWSPTAMAVGSAFRSRGVGSCQGIFYVLAGFHGAMAVMFVSARPFAVPITNYLAGLAALITTGLLICSAIFDANQELTTVVKAILALAIAQSVLTVLRFSIVVLFTVCGSRLFKGAVEAECVWSYEAPFGSTLLDGRKPTTSLTTISAKDGRMFGHDVMEDDDLEEMENPLEDHKTAHKLAKLAGDGATSLLPTRVLRRRHKHRQVRTAEKEAVIARLERIRSGQVAPATQEEHLLAITVLDNPAVLEAYLGTSSSSSSSEVDDDIGDGSFDDDRTDISNTLRTRSVGYQEGVGTTVGLAKESSFKIMKSGGRVMKRPKLMKDAATDTYGIPNPMPLSSAPQQQLLLEGGEFISNNINNDSGGAMNATLRQPQQRPRPKRGRQPAASSDAAMVQEFEAFLSARRQRENNNNTNNIDVVGGAITPSVGGVGVGLSPESALASPYPVPLHALSSGALDVLANGDYLPADPAHLNNTQGGVGGGNWDDWDESPTSQNGKGKGYGDADTEEMNVINNNKGSSVADVAAAATTGGIVVPATKNSRPMINMAFSPDGDDASGADQPLDSTINIQVTSTPPLAATVPRPRRHVTIKSPYLQPNAANSGSGTFNNNQQQENENNYSVTNDSISQGFYGGGTSSFSGRGGSTIIINESGVGLGSVPAAIASNVPRTQQLQQRTLANPIRRTESRRLQKKFLKVTGTSTTASASGVFAPEGGPGRVGGGVGVGVNAATTTTSSSSTASQVDVGSPYTASPLQRDKTFNQEPAPFPLSRETDDKSDEWVDFSEI